MITKTKHNYYTLESRFNEKELVKVKHRGYKITVKNLVFYSDEEYYIKKITEESTGLGINVKARDLQELEKLINYGYDNIAKQLDKYKNDCPNWELKNIKEVEE